MAHIRTSLKIPLTSYRVSGGWLTRRLGEKWQLGHWLHKSTCVIKVVSGRRWVQGGTHIHWRIILLPETEEEYISLQWYSHTTWREWEDIVPKRAGREYMTVGSTAHMVVTIKWEGPFLSTIALTPWVVPLLWRPWPCKGGREESGLDQSSSLLKFLRAN